MTMVPNDGNAFGGDQFGSPETGSTEFQGNANFNNSFNNNGGDGGGGGNWGGNGDTNGDGQQQFNANPNGEGLMSRTDRSCSFHGTKL